MLKSFLRLSDLPFEKLNEILELASNIKQTPSQFSHRLRGHSVALLFQKNSTRTRTAFETGIAEMGGHPVYLDWSQTNFSNDRIQDEAICLGSYVKAIVARVFGQEDLESLKNHSRVPVINALSDECHPTQILSDMLTLQDYFGKELRGVQVAFIGDGNNVCHSLIEASAIFGFQLSVATPKSYAPKIVNPEFAGPRQRTFLLFDNPEEAVKGADVIYTDSWVSLGQEAEAEARIKAFKAFTVDRELVGNTGKDSFVMHCLPANRGFEITNEVIDSNIEFIRCQAMNKKPVKQALLLYLIENSEEYFYD